MDGKNMVRMLRQLLNEPSSSTFLDDRTSYDYLYEAAKEWVRQTKCLTAEQEITTVAEQSGYTLNGDFLEMFLKHNGKYYVKLNDGDVDYFISFKKYNDILYANQTDSVVIPSNFTITDDRTLDDIVTGAASAESTATGGKSKLTAATELFGDVTEGDIVHNTTDSSDGPVVLVSSTKELYTCLFGGTNNYWEKDDALIIQPRGRMKIVFNPPLSTADYTVTVYYLKKPIPVYSDYDVYPFAIDYAEALVKYAAWLYKYKDSKPTFGDAFYVYWTRKICEKTRQ